MVVMASVSDATGDGGVDVDGVRWRWYGDGVGEKNKGDVVIAMVMDLPYDLSELFLVAVVDYVSSSGHARILVHPHIQRTFSFNAVEHRAVVMMVVFLMAIAMWR